MTGQQRNHVDRRKFIRLTGGTALGALAVGGGAFPASADVLADHTPALAQGRSPCPRC
ncbi:hypothetical protein MBT84_45855 [Streptomyces sp. MBT84]|nr:hypothetical protein [Streptomyces sp. MBT84]